GAASKTVPVGLELYTVRDELAKDLTGTVRAVAKMGYEVVEFYAPYFSWTTQTATEVRKLMDDLGIRCNSTHNGAVSFRGDGWKTSMELNQVIGSRYIVMASPPGGSNTAAAWKNVAALLSEAAETLKPLGMSTGYHNHQAEWTPVEGQRPMDILA